MKRFIKSICFLFIFLLFCVCTQAQKFDSVKTLFKNKTYVPTALPLPVDSSKIVNVSPESAVLCDGTDVRVFASNHPQSEVHLSIDKTNANNIIASANTFTNNYNQGYYYTTNGGTTWAGADQLVGSTVLFGDPSTAYDANGNAFVSSMIPNAAQTDADGYYLQKTANKGVTWAPLVRGSDTRLQFDKSMIAADNYSTSPYKNRVYAAWTDLSGNASIRFNSTLNGGTSFTAPITLKSSNGYGQGTNVQTGFNGEIYVCWADYTDRNLPAKGMGFCVSMNGGTSFSSPTIPVHYTGIRGLNGADPTFNNTRVNDFPSMAVDKSNGPNKGRIYIVFAARENGNGKAVIQLAWSDNRGSTFTVPKTISIASGRQSWFPWIAVDDSNGKVYVDYYCFDQAAGFATNTYVAYSLDGGVTFQNQIVSDVPHTTQAINNTLFAAGYAGDYIGMTAYGGKTYAAWMDNRSGVWQIYVTRVIDMDISGNDYFCSSGTYSISNLPAGASVSWSIAPSTGTATLTQSSNQATLVKVANGVVTLTANVSTGCRTAVVVTKNVTAGNPFPTGVTNAISDYTNYTGSLQTSVSFFLPAGITGLATFNITDTRFSSFNWTPVNIPAGASWTSGGPLNQQLNITVRANGTAYTQTSATVHLTATGPCGAYSNDFTANAVTSSSSSPAFSVAPNPANNTVTVTPKTDNLKSAFTPSSIQEVRIFDMQGNLKKVQKFNRVRQTQVNVSDLKTGIYMISISDGSGFEKQQLVIQR